MELAQRMGLLRKCAPETKRGLEIIGGPIASGVEYAQLGMQDDRLASQITAAEGASFRLISVNRASISGPDRTCSRSFLDAVGESEKDALARVVHARSRQFTRECLVLRRHYHGQHPGAGKAGATCVGTSRQNTLSATWFRPAILSHVGNATGDEDANLRGERQHQALSAFSTRRARADPPRLQCAPWSHGASRSRSGSQAAVALSPPAR
jgi:hypothetical protein